MRARSREASAPIGAKELTMPESSEQKKSPDLYGMSGVARQIDRAAPTCRAYARALHARGTVGVLRADNGDFYATAAGVKALAKEAAARSARKPGG
jgi:hypothetical protein